MVKAEEQLRVLKRKVSDIISQVRSLIDDPPELKSAADLDAHEYRLLTLTDELAGVGMAVCVQQVLLGECVQGAVLEMLSGQKRYKCDGQRETQLTFSRGTPQLIVSVYYRRKTSGASARGKESGQVSCFWVSLNNAPRRPVPCLPFGPAP